MLIAKKATTFKFLKLMYHTLKMIVYQLTVKFYFAIYISVRFQIPKRFQYNKFHPVNIKGKLILSKLQANNNELIYLFENINTNEIPSMNCF